MTDVAVLGTGIMGAGMARSLLRSGARVHVWNRSPEKAKALESDGATAYPEAAAAVADVDAVVTMVFDEQAVESVMQPVLAAMPDGAVWVQAATIGVDATIRCAELAERAGIGFVDAPVLGTRTPAEEGTLIVLAGGPAGLRPSVDPVFDAIGSRTVWVGENPGDGHRLKLAANSWVLSVVGATAQAIALTRSLGLDPGQFLETIAGGPLDCAYAQLKGKAMIAGEVPPSFTLAGAVKDSQLIADALRDAGADPSLMAALHDRFAAAADSGHADEDMAAVFTAFAPAAAP